MALTVFLVDNQTRLVLPDSQWAYDVRDRLKELGHVLTVTSLDAEQVNLLRKADELRRVDDLLEKTGL